MLRDCFNWLQIVRKIKFWLIVWIDNLGFLRAAFHDVDCLGRLSLLGSLRNLWTSMSVTVRLLVVAHNDFLLRIIWEYRVGLRLDELVIRFLDINNDFRFLDSHEGLLDHRDMGDWPLNERHLLRFYLATHWNLFQVMSLH